LNGAKVSPARAAPEVAPLFARDLDLHLPPRSVGLLVRRHVADRVLCADLGDDFLVHAVEILHRSWEERAAAGCVGDRLKGLECARS
jgi:hypothetical protein